MPREQRPQGEQQTLASVEARSWKQPAGLLPDLEPLVALREVGALQVLRGHPQMAPHRQAWAEKQADALAPIDRRSQRDG